MIQEIGAQQFELPAYDFALALAKRSGYLTELQADLSIEGRARLENMEEFFNGIKEFNQTDGQAPFSEDEVEGPLHIHHFLANVALLTHTDEEEDDAEPKVKLMTVHQSKGLEFPFVYIVGLEENLFPGTSAAGNLKELEEERRLFYVALTRAKQAVSLSFAKSRFRWGSVTHNNSSRFLREIEPCHLAQPTQEKPDKERAFGDRKTKSLVQINSRLSIPSSQHFAPSSQPSAFSAGQRVEHERFGQGTVISVETGDKAVVSFDAHGTKTLLLKFAKMQILS